MLGPTSWHISCQVRSDRSNCHVMSHVKSHDMLCHMSWHMSCHISCQTSSRIIITSRHMLSHMSCHMSCHIISSQMSCDILSHTSRRTLCLVILYFEPSIFAAYKWYIPLGFSCQGNSIKVSILILCRHFESRSTLGSAAYKWYYWVPEMCHFCLYVISGILKLNPY